MLNHALEIHVQPDNTALCFIASPSYGVVAPTARNSVQLLTLNDGVNRVLVSVTGRPISIDDIKRIARQAVERNYDAV